MEIKEVPGGKNKPRETGKKRPGIWKTVKQLGIKPGNKEKGKVIAREIPGKPGKRPGESRKSREK